ncbi:MAG: DNA alkylation repair protein [Prevotellaceae bacterium]|jgi:3-methyladenine DNA glycosylase AlkD|nr:DNA alkylation repair protein [Prevotellaceae bacterium]
MSAKFLIEELTALADNEQAAFLQGFFKTGKGQYAEGDVFLGIKVPKTRAIIKAYKDMPLHEIETLLYSEFHEVRLAGFLLLVEQFKKTDDTDKLTQIYNFYLEHARQANNWDLVDLSCRDIVGGYLLDKKDRSRLYRLSLSSNLWEQRISIVSTWMFIKHLEFEDTLRISETLLTHKHDLIHKAVGWMLREAGKKDKSVLIAFLERHSAAMPRTTLRYAIEHLAPNERQKYMNNKHKDK